MQKKESAPRPKRMSAADQLYYQKLLQKYPFWISVHAVAEFFGVSRQVVYEWIYMRDNPLPTYKLPGMKQMRIKTVDLIEFIERIPQHRP